MKRVSIVSIFLLLFLFSHFSSAQDQRTYDINLTGYTHLKVVSRMEKTTLGTRPYSCNVSLFFYYCDSETTKISDIKVQIWLKIIESDEILNSTWLDFRDLEPEDVAGDKIVQTKFWFFSYDRDYGKCGIYIRATCKEERTSGEPNIFNPPYAYGFWIYPIKLFQLYYPIFMSLIFIGSTLIIFASVFLLIKQKIRKSKDEKMSGKSDEFLEEEWGTVCMNCGSFVFFDEEICTKCGEKAIQKE